ncbi:hypothetical protein G6L37_06355 [Agrobacterium rubi]|nr:hypothetical protein [Agrobacterium rubi]NTF24984.1 hypothetical protein [Agrobacterium rubi]
MGKKKTFGKVAKYDLLDWAKGYHREITVTTYDEGFLYGILEVDGKKRQIRMSGDGDFLQICDGSFDRWANSVGAQVSFPWTEGEFVKALDELCAIPLKKIRADREAFFNA